MKEIPVEPLVSWLSQEQQRLNHIARKTLLQDLRFHFGESQYEQGILVSSHAGRLVNRLFLVPAYRSVWAMPYYLDDTPVEVNYAPWMRRTIVHPDPPSFRVAHLGNDGRLRKDYTWPQRMQQAGVPAHFIEKYRDEIEAYTVRCKEEKRCA